MVYIKRNRIKELKRWHIWFAWYPVKVATTPDGDYEKVWLNNVLRCGRMRFTMEGDYLSYRYKKIKQEEKTRERY